MVTNIHPTKINSTKLLLVNMELSKTISNSNTHSKTWDINNSNQWHSSTKTSMQEVINIIKHQHHKFTITKTKGLSTQIKVLDMVDITKWQLPSHIRLELNTTTKVRIIKVLLITKMVLQIKVITIKRLVLNSIKRKNTTPTQPIKISSITTLQEMILLIGKHQLALPLKRQMERSRTYLQEL